MKKIIIFWLFFIKNIQSTELQCSQKYNEEPPFYVSNQYRQGEKIWENLRDIENSLKTDTYLPIGSIVYTPPEIFNFESERDSLVPIEVLSLPSEEREETLRNARRSNRKLKIELFKKMKTGKKKRAKKGDIGFLHSKSLIPAGKYSYYVKRGSPLFPVDEKLLLNESYFRFKYDPATKKYETRYCCEILSPDDFVKEEEEICVEHYMLEVFDQNNKVSRVLPIDLEKCQIMSSILPIENEDLSSLATIVDLIKDAQFVEESFSFWGIENLEIIPTEIPYEKNSSGLVKFPVEMISNEGPYNSYHYKSDDDVASDVFVNPLAACTFMQVLKTFQKSCSGPGCQVQIGDMYHEPSWKVHRSHGSGKCIDIRPFRKEDDNDAPISTSLIKRYDREKTLNFIEHLAKAGGGPIYFNDKEILKKFKDKNYRKKILPGMDTRWNNENVPRWEENHYNHIHVCFNSENSLVQKSCKEGIR